ncbi:MAG: fatty acyl-AMP ligase, partial [Phormidesmis sp.]
MNHLASRQPVSDPPSLETTIPSATTLLERLRWRAVHQPERVAYQFLADQPLPVAESAITVWTYAQLYERVAAIATQLQQQARETGRDLNQQPVLLVYSPGLELIAAFLACLCVGAIAIPAAPPRRHESLARWQHIVTDAKVAGILTEQDLLEDLEPLIGKELFQQRTDSLFCLATDRQNSRLIENAYGSERSFLDNLLDTLLAKGSPQEVAFLQYTSGSTSQPKGVMVTHANLAHNLQQIQQAFGHSADTRCVIWLPPYHDMGLIGGILQPLYGGYPVTLMSPAAFLRNPYRWLEAVSHFGGTTSGAPNFAYDYCVQKISSQQRQSLDLTAWTVAFTGAEPIRSQTLDQFAKAFSSCGFRRRAFYPCYGLAEATLFVSGGLPQALPKVVSVSASSLAEGRAEEAEENAQAVQLVSCGQSKEQKIEIVDPQTRLVCDEGQVGEIWVAGESVAAGYWGKVAATKEAFGNELDGKSGAFLRTGDLGFLRSGELFITGRLKDLIVVRGQNYYPQDIELSVGQAHPSLQPAGAVFGLGPDETGTDREQIVVVQEITRTAVRSLRKQTLQVSDIVEAIRSAVSNQHGLQVWAIALLKPGHLPKTTSGKVQRQSCKSQFLAGSLDAVE